MAIFRDQFDDEGQGILDVMDINSMSLEIAVDDEAFDIRIYTNRTKK